MKTINFEQVEVAFDIEGKQTEVQDVRKNFANIMYKHGTGIEFHALALKIYNSKGKEVYTEEECELIRKTSTLCAPFFMSVILNLHCCS